MSCPGNKQWYVCTKGNFHGCCSSDPCNSGICPDDSQGTDQPGSRSNPVTSLTPPPTTNSPPTTTATKPTTSPKTGSGASASLPTTIMSSSSSLPSAETLTAAPETASTTGSSDNGGHSSVHGGLIGGVVAGSVAAFLLAIGIILLVCYRSRKKRGKEFTLLGWYRPQYIRGRRYPRQQQQQRSGCGNGRGACCGGAHEKTAGGGSGTMSSCNCSSTLSSMQRAGIPISSSTTTPSACAVGANTPDSATKLLANTPPSMTSSPKGQFQPYQSTVKTRPPLETIPSQTLIHQEKGNQQPQQQEITPELGDTGFYRPRVELATYSQSELINVPREARVRQQHRPLPAQEPAAINTAINTTRNTANTAPTTAATSPNTEPGITKTPSKRIVTPDGAVLAANFESPSPESGEHATSFARGYDGRGYPYGLWFELGHVHGPGYRNAAEDGGQLPAYHPGSLMREVNEGDANADVNGVHKI